MTAALAAGLLAGWSVALPVGPVGAYLVALTARTSLRVGISAALGVATADGLYALLAAAGGAAVAGPLGPVLGAVRAAAALILLAGAAVGAARAIRQARRRGPLPPGGPGARPAGVARAYAGLLGATLANPATIVYFAALAAGGGMPRGAPAAMAAAFAAAAFSASASWQIALAGGGAALGRALTGRRGRAATAAAGSLIMAALAVRLLLTPGTLPPRF